MAVKIIIRRNVPELSREDIYPLLKQLREHALNQDGYISGETLRSFDNPDEFVVIGTWRSLEDWKTWEAHPERQELQASIDMLLSRKTEYGAYYYI